MSASSPIHRRGLIAAVSAAALATSVLAAAPASARPLENLRFVEEESFTDEDFCGAGVSVDVELTREVHVLFNTRKPGTAPYWGGNFSVDVRYTNEAGDTVTEIVRGYERDLKITDHGDGTMTILVLSTGNATVYDESGTAIARNPGQVRYEVLIDHGGTPDDPSDDEFIAFLGLVKESTGRTDDFCAAVLPILG
ncbi:hypothetical protein [Agromyces sp. GXS1127]|uniref:hypothetical protein n=1 Tax=Agromyces sp. GXS1127 TaxID=3424181 RepID=UPI003D314A76